MPKALAETLYNVSAHKGAYVRLDWAYIQEALVPTDLDAPQCYIHNLVSCLPWQLSRKYKFAQLSNLQVMRGFKAEVKEACRLSADG